MECAPCYARVGLVICEQSIPVNVRQIPKVPLSSTPEEILERLYPVYQFVTEREGPSLQQRRQQHQKRIADRILPTRGVPYIPISRLLRIQGSSTMANALRHADALLQKASRKAIAVRPSPFCVHEFLFPLSII